MSRATNPDRVFAEDPATIPLNHKRGVLLSRLRKLVDPSLSVALMPTKAPPDWPQEAVELHAQYKAVTSELARLNSRRMSQQLSRFLATDDQEEGQSKAALRWWLDRY